jgi:hypothetical protein
MTERDVLSDNLGVINLFIYWSFSDAVSSGEYVASDLG